MLGKVIADRFLKALEHIEYGTFNVTTPDGKRHTFSGNTPGAHADFIVHDWKVFSSLATKGDIGLAEDYRDGLWDSDNPSGLLLVGLQNEKVLSQYIYGSTLFSAITQIVYLFRRNTVKGSKRNIHAHYDLGNEFYKLWLDPTMTYSSALFKNQNEALEKAQSNKYDRIIERLNTGSGKMLEVGCGWGGFSERALQRGDFDIKGITISEEQHAYAKDRLNDSANIALEDYRHQEGKYDYLISIEMFEAVGEKFWPTYFGKLKSLLHQSGKAVIQTITIDDAFFDSYRRGGDMIRSFIFPGGALPSPEQFEKEANKVGLKITDRYDFGLDYAKTLDQWLIKFDAKKAQVTALGFDEPFIRLWRLYLSTCIASFSAERTGVMQVELQHA